MYTSRVDISPNSGLLRVTIHPSRHPWLSIPLQAVGFAFLLCFAYGVLNDFNWPQDVSVIYVISGIWLLTVVQTAFQYLGVEIIEINAEKIMVSKVLHGWERKREYIVTDCSDLEWKEGKHWLLDVVGLVAFLLPSFLPGLKCKCGKKTVLLSKNLLPDQVNDIFIALQRTLPQVTLQLNSYPVDKENKEKLTILKLH